MLEREVLAMRICDAMDKHQPEPITPAAVARTLGVTPQAVNGWRKKGRISKKHLLGFARLTGKSASYFLGGDLDKSLEAQAFQLAEEWMSLKNPDHRDAVRDLLNGFLSVVQRFPELHTTMDNAEVTRRIAPAGKTPSVRRAPIRGGKRG